MNNSTNFGVANLSGDLAYDLRQKYAQIVGEHLEDISQARKADNYSVYYKTLKDLFVIVKHKIDKKKIDYIDPKGQKKEILQIEYFEILNSNAVLIANKYPRTWLGLDKKPEACSLIEEALNQMEMFLYDKIDEAKMFGGGNYTPGL